FIELEIARRQGPVAPARVDSAAAQQELRLPQAYGADDDLWVLVIDEAAIGTDHALAIVAFGNGEDAGDAGRGRIGHGFRRRRACRAAAPSSRASDEEIEKLPAHQLAARCLARHEVAAPAL